MCAANNRFAIAVHGSCSALNSDRACTAYARGVPFLGVDTPGYKHATSPRLGLGRKILHPYIGSN